VARTPSKEAHEKVLDAALELIAERGIEGTSMDAIAGASGVSKATVYKHWENKDALLIDLIRQRSGKDPEFSTGNPRQDMVDFIRYITHKRKSEDLVRIWPRIIGYAMTNAGFAEALREHAFGPRREIIRSLLRQAAEKRELRADVDPDFALDLLIGPIMHRRFLDEKSIPRDLPDRVVEYFWKAFERRR